MHFEKKYYFYFKIDTIKINIINTSHNKHIINIIKKEEGRESRIHYESCSNIIKIFLGDIFLYNEKKYLINQSENA